MDGASVPYKIEECSFAGSALSHERLRSKQNVLLECFRCKRHRPSQEGNACHKSPSRHEETP